MVWLAIPRQCEHIAGCVINHADIPPHKFARMVDPQDLYQVRYAERRTVIEFLNADFLKLEISDQDLDACCERLKAIVTERVTKDAICFDLGRLIVCPSSLLAIMVWLRDFAPQIQLLNVSNPVMHALAVTQLDRLFEIPQLNEK